MAQPVRILHIGLTSVPGGMESFVLNYYRHIDRTKFQFDFVDIYGEGLAYSEEIKNLGGQIFTLPNCKKHPFSYTKALHKLLKQSQHPIVHIHMLSAANPIAATITCLCKKQVIIHSHNAAIPKGILRHVLNTTNRNLLRLLPAQHWACGEKAGKWMFGKDFDAKNVITNAIDVEKFARNEAIRQQLRTKCNFASTDKVVGFVGRFCEQKNVLFLADILQALHQKSANYKMLLVGDGELRPALADKLESLGLLSYVYFAGIQRNVADWYQAMDYFVLPSLFEGLPIVGVEAQASGLPCFFSDCISSELGLTPQAHFLPINQGATVWAQAIDSYISVVPSPLPQQWDIRCSIETLEKRYDAQILEALYVKA